MRTFTSGRSARLRIALVTCSIVLVSAWPARGQPARAGGLTDSDPWRRAVAAAAARADSLEQLAAFRTAQRDSAVTYARLLERDLAVTSFRCDARQDSLRWDLRAMTWRAEACERSRPPWLWRQATSPPVMITVGWLLAMLTQDAVD